MMKSRGMGAISPSKMPGGVKKARRDDTDFTEFKKGGKVKRYSGEEGSAVSLEEQYPGAKITRLEPGPLPESEGKGSEQHIKNLQWVREKYKKSSEFDPKDRAQVGPRPNESLAPYEQKEIELRGTRGGRGPSGGGGAGVPVDKMLKMRSPYYKKGGKIKKGSKK